MTDMQLNVVICTHNRINLLLNAIKSIYSATIPNQINIRLLVIANACTDNTIVELEKFKQASHANKCIFLNVEPEPRSGKSYALNKALDLINDGFICFIDDDQTVAPDFFESVVNAIVKQPNISIFCGRIFPDWQGDEPSWIFSEGKYRIYPPPIPVFDLGDTPLLIPDECESLPGGGHTIVKKEVFDRIGGFSESLGPIGHNLVGSEDTDFFYRAVNAGEKIYYSPDIKQLHYVDKNRLKTTYLLLKSFQRNRSITASRQDKANHAPLYLYKKLLLILCNILVSFDMNRLRFYLMRFFSTLGEIAGHFK